MTPREFRTRIAALARAMGPEGEIYVSIWSRDREDSGALEATVYPRGLAERSAFSVRSDDFDDLIDTLKARWADHLLAQETRTIRLIALEVIRITDELGECTDAALLRAGIGRDEVERHGAAALDLADAMAPGGPFSILRTSDGAPR